MNKYFLSLFLFVIVHNLNAQQLQWSGESINPKERNIFNLLSFPGNSGSSYIVHEVDAGGTTFNRKSKSYFHVIDPVTLKKTREVSMKDEMKNFPGKPEDYTLVSHVVLKDRYLYIFVNRRDKKVYPLYYQLYDGSGKLLKDGNTGLTADTDKLEMDGSKFYDSYIASHAFHVEPSYDSSSIITVTVKEHLGRESSIVNISEWDENFSNLSSSDYKVPLVVFNNFVVSKLFGRTKTTIKTDPQIYSVKKDPNGFYYLSVGSANAKDEYDVNLKWIYQLKKNDPGYFKSYRPEFGSVAQTASVKLFQDPDGSIHMAATGVVNDDKIKELNDNNVVNTYYIGSFSPGGNLDKVVGGMLDKEWMKLFDGDKSMRFYDAVKLYVKNIYKTSDGGLYIAWQNEWTEIVQGQVYNHIYFYSGNMRIQYYNPSKKLMWEKPVHMLHAGKDHAIEYSGVRSVLINDELYLVYPDDKKNALKDISDPKVEKFSVVKFGNKDLAGFFTTRFTPKGEVKRQYHAWPQEKIDHALILPSIRYMGNGQFMATTREVKQGSGNLTEGKFTVVRFGL